MDNNDKKIIGIPEQPNIQPNSGDNGQNKVNNFNAQSVVQAPPKNEDDGKASENNLSGVVPVAPPKVNIDTTKYVQPVQESKDKDKEEDNRIIKPLIEKTEILEEEKPKPIVEEKVEEAKEEKKVEAPIMENVQMKRVEVQYKEPNFIKIAFAVVIFIALLVFVVFLPDILSYFEVGKEPQIDVPGEKVITEGTLSCSMENSNEKFDFINNYEFHFKDKSLKSINISEITKGNVSLDYDELNLNYGLCKNLETSLDSTKNTGVSISCDLYDGTLTKTQTVDFETLNLEVVTPIYKQNSMQFPEYEKDENIETIESNMEASGYTCQINEN